MFGVSFGEKHSYTDFGLIFNTKTISEPSPITKMVAVPSRNGSVDMSEVLTNDIRYNDRTISIEFTITDLAVDWEAKRMDIANEIHGKKLRIVFDDDIAFYWYGRVEVGAVEPDGTLAKLKITATVEPFKYNITTSAEDWLWDPFDFDYGVINEFGNISVNGTYAASLICTGKVETPIITVSAPMTAKLDNATTVSLTAGQNVVYDFVLDEGTHTIVLTGNGTASINYVGGSL